MYAVNDPKKYPSRPLTQESEINDSDDNPNSTMDDTDRARLDALFGALAQQSNNLPPTKPGRPQSASEKPTEQES